jgi:drug/metabolite transporter (DMT)-like permease
MIGEISSLFNALSIALANTLGGKSTQISSWRNTLRGSSLITMAIISIALLFNFESISLRVVLIGLAAGVIGGLGLPYIYQAFSIGSVSFVSPVATLVQTFNLIVFAVIVENEQLSITFPIAAALGVAGIFACSRTSSTGTSGSAGLKVFGLTIIAACFFSGFSLLMTLIENNEIIPALFGCRIGVLVVSFIFSPTREIKQGNDIPQVNRKKWRKYALLSGACEIAANLTYMLAIANLELSKVGIIMASSPALATIIGIKLMKQKPLLINWLGIAATSAALIIIAVA